MRSKKKKKDDCTRKDDVPLGMKKGLRYRVKVKGVLEQSRAEQSTQFEKA